MTNKERIILALNKEGYQLGYYAPLLDNLNRNNLKKVLTDIGYGSTDIKVFYNRKPYIIELMEVDFSNGTTEVDFMRWTLEDYKNEYGSGILSDVLAD